MKSQTMIKIAAAAALALMLCAGAAHAEQVDPAKAGPLNVGPPTPYGETPAEAAAKLTAFQWARTMLIERDPKKAFELYVSKDYCNHGHLGTRGLKDCENYDEALASAMSRYTTPLKPGQTVEFPNLASVNGEMVTMYGEGVDIFRVVNGKITDHWDASPPAAVSIRAHHPDFAKWVMGDRKTPPPMLPREPEAKAK